MNHSVPSPLRWKMRIAPSSKVATGFKGRSRVTVNAQGVGLHQVGVLQSLGRACLLVTPWTVARQAPLSTLSQSLLKFMSIELVMASNHLILCRPLLLSLSQHQGPFQWVSSLHQVAKVLVFNISPSNKYSGLISFRTDWFDLTAVQGTLKSLFQHHNSKLSVLWHSAFFMIQLTHPYVTTGTL